MKMSELWNKLEALDAEDNAQVMILPETLPVQTIVAVEVESSEIGPPTVWLRCEEI